MSFGKKIVKIIAIGAFISLFFIHTNVLADTLGAVSGENVNVRTGASLSSPVAMKFANGQALSIIGESGDFYKVNVDGEDLYISKQFVELFTAEGVITTNSVNIRQEPNTNSIVLGKLSEGNRVSVLGQANGWYEISVDGIEGFVKSDFVNGALLSSVPTITAIANNAMPTIHNSSNLDFHGIVNTTSGLRLREAPSTNADVIMVMHRGQPFEILDNQGDWQLVNVGGKIGFVSSEFVTIRDGSIPEGSALATEIIDYGKQFLGTPYSWAGTNLKTGVDCSGFVYSVFKNFGITLNRSSRGMSTQGVAVSKNELMPGDLVFFDTFAGANKGNISHVGIYMGNGNFIHSSSSKRTWGVVISSLDEEYYTNNYVSARRILNN